MKRKAIGAAIVGLLRICQLDLVADVTEEKTLEKRDDGSVQEICRFRRNGKGILKRTILTPRKGHRMGQLMVQEVFVDGKGLLRMTRCDLATSIQSEGREGISWSLIRDKKLGKTQLTVTREDTGVIELFEVTENGLRPVSDEKLRGYAKLIETGVEIGKSFKGKTTLEEARPVLKRLQDLGKESQEFLKKAD
jgi:hypothetical protein